MSGKFTNHFSRFGTGSGYRNADWRARGYAVNHTGNDTPDAVSRIDPQWESFFYFFGPHSFFIGPLHIGSASQGIQLHVSAESNSPYEQHIMSAPSLGQLLLVSRSQFAVMITNVQDVVTNTPGEAHLGYPSMGSNGEVPSIEFAPLAANVVAYLSSVTSTQAVVICLDRATGSPVVGTTVRMCAIDRGSGGITGTSIV